MQRVRAELKARIDALKEDIFIAPPASYEKLQFTLGQYNVLTEMLTFVEKTMKEED